MWFSFFEVLVSYLYTGGRRTPDAEDKKEVEKSDEKNDETKNDESETVGAPTSGTGGTDVENQ